MSTTFTAGFDQANADFAAIDGETFKVLRNGVVGTYSSMTINDLSFASSKSAGGIKPDIDVILWISDAVMEEADIVEGTMLRVRDKRVRVTQIRNDGHNTKSVACQSAAVGL